jgi:hypothetical protein
MATTVTLTATNTANICSRLGPSASSVRNARVLPSRFAMDLPTVGAKRRRIIGKCRQELAWTENEGEFSDYDDEFPADQHMRGQAGLVTAACPRRCPRDLDDRRRLGKMIPADFSNDELLDKFRRVVLTHTNVKLVKGTCHDEPHKRFRRSADRRERHKHLPFLMTSTFAHKKVAEAFYKQHGLRIWFSFRLHRFVGNLFYCMEPGKKPSTDLDLSPARFPAGLDLREELKANSHPGAEPPKERKKRKRLSFDEVSNIILEGLGDGPLTTGKALEEAAKTLKLKGQIELWNYVGDMKSPQDVNGLVEKVWRLHGKNEHHMWRAKAEYDVSSFNLEGLGAVRAFRNGAFKKRALILSGDGGLGKTNLGEALANEICPGGYWFVDDPDDFKELEGLLQPGHAIVMDEISLHNYNPNQIKRLFDLEKARRIKCRHFNGTKPKGCPLILCTNSVKEKFFPRLDDKHDRTGISRRHLFQDVVVDVRRLLPKQQVTAAPTAAPQAGSWQEQLFRVCETASLKGGAGSVLSAALDLGVAMVSELREHASEIATRAALKPLERKRLLAALAPPTAPHLDGDDDPFGFGGGFDAIE